MDSHGPHRLRISQAASKAVKSLSLCVDGEPELAAAAVTPFPSGIACRPAALASSRPPLQPASRFEIFLCLFRTGLPLPTPHGIYSLKIVLLFPIMFLFEVAAAELGDAGKRDIFGGALCQDRTLREDATVRHGPERRYEHAHLCRSNATGHLREGSSPHPNDRSQYISNCRSNGLQAAVEAPSE